MHIRKKCRNISYRAPNYPIPALQWDTSLHKNTRSNLITPGPVYLLLSAIGRFDPGTTSRSTAGSNLLICARFLCSSRVGFISDNSVKESRGTGNWTITGREMQRNPRRWRRWSERTLLKMVISSTEIDIGPAIRTVCVQFCMIGSGRGTARLIGTRSWGVVRWDRSL